MSATNRGSKRSKNDFYPTPYDSIEALLKNYDFSKHGLNVLEPSAGNGNICKMYKDKYPNSNITGVELDERHIEELSTKCDKVICTDFMEFDTNNKFDVIIGNPPFSMAVDFIKKSMEHLNENGVLCFLFRTALLESDCRFEFWKQNPVNGLLTLHKRPSFTGKGTDATSYFWFIWTPGNDQQFIKVI